VLGFLLVSAALGCEELLLGVTQILHNAIASVGHSGILLQRIASGDTGLHAALGYEAVHGVDVNAVGFTVGKNLADRVVLAGLRPPAPLGQGGALG